MDIYFNNKKDKFFSRQIIIDLSILKIYKTSIFLFIKGPLGSLPLTIPLEINLKQVDNKLLVFGKLIHKPLILTFYKKVVQSFRGVEFGFFDRLIIKGTG
jgi:hypothetical protein